MDGKKVVLIILFIVAMIAGGFFFFGRNEESIPVSGPDQVTCSVGEMVEVFMRSRNEAEERYLGKNLSVTGKLVEMDLDGNLIALADEKDPLEPAGLTCFLKDGDMTEKVKAFRIGQTVTVNGKVTDVQEVLGYYMELEDIARND